MNCDAKLMDLEAHFGDWVRGNPENTKGNCAKMTSELYPYENIFSPIKVNKTLIKNESMKVFL